MPSLSVVIPAYNEEQAIQEVARRVLAVRPALAGLGVADVELIVVDDASVDRTAELARELPDVRVLSHPSNSGYGAALKTGFGAARGELLAFLDADGTYPPEELPKLCSVLLAEDADIVIGSRMAGSPTEMPLVRRLGNLLFARLVSFATAHRVTDSASGMRVFRREVLERIYPLPDGLNLTPVMSTRAIHEGAKVVEVPIRYHERTGQSKLHVLRDGTRFAQSILWTALMYNPVRQLGLVGLGFLSVAVGIGLVLTAQRLRGVTVLGPLGVFSLYLAATLAVVGVSIFALGATFNYLVALFHKRPIRQGMTRKSLFVSGVDRHFGWLGVMAIAGGILVGLVSLVLGLNGWEIARLWFWQLIAAMLLLVGLQLVVSWLIMRVLEALSQRDAQLSRPADARDGASGCADAWTEP